ncbi:MAG TPA: NADH-quinone oxidoreductase subunit NuoE [Candidatus Cloacimonadota bacterium]|nr:NADH-quinone oxidoreductase subunit NuoE [Candidatus Cloacimonadota bacterium]HQB41670.1 NADH-quinone oxidoreductase subunit NuoE [Candidatus Cloacimonadota bacterium]
MYEKIFSKYTPERENLIYILHDIQDNHPQNYISEEAVAAVGKYLRVAPAHIYGVLTFYTMFSTKPRGKNIIRLCESPPCFLKGSDKIIAKLRELLNIRVGETTGDELFTLETCACLGVCGNAPVMMINEDVYGDLTEEIVTVIINKLKGEKL